MLSVYCGPGNYWKYFVSLNLCKLHKKQTLFCLLQNDRIVKELKELTLSDSQVYYPVCF